MTNKEEFEYAVIRNHLTKKKIAQKLDISEQALYNKINNIAEFKASELDKLYEMFKLKTLDSQRKIFFCK